MRPLCKKALRVSPRADSSALKLDSVKLVVAAAGPTGHCRTLMHAFNSYRSDRALLDSSFDGS